MSDQVYDILSNRVNGLRQYLNEVEQLLQEYKQVQQALKTSEERFHLLVESVKDYAIFLLDTEGRVTTWNRGAQNIKGYQEEEILGKHFAHFYTEEDQAANIPAHNLQIAIAEGRLANEGWRVRKDGSHFWAHVTITPVYDEDQQLRGFAKVTRDVTEKRRLEHERDQHYQDLQQALQIRDEFLLVAAHELKTPITNLRGFAQVILRQFEKSGTLDPSRLQRAFAAIDYQSDKLAQLVVQLLDIARLQGGQLNLERITTNVVALVEEVVNRMHMVAPERGLIVEAPEPVQALVDPLRLEQVLNNLIDNALKYAPADTLILITVGAVDNGKIRISVTDRGPGIPSNQQQRIFDPFYRGAVSDGVPGVGLGLYISRQIVHLHHGKLLMEFPPEGGTQFIVELPEGDAE